ncbi:MAG: trigger factor [Tannerellaceae bacterium]|jgi:trigger factor|nr:trigger factor [Tannerellaceae bacterium]
MNISFSKQDAVSGILKIKMAKEDCAVQVEAGLRHFRRNANMPGFRKGMVPMGIINKMYGKHVLAEEMNKLVSETLLKHIQENNIDILGDPLPNETEQQAFDFDTQEEFEFCFDLALAPDIHIKLSSGDHLDYYRVIVDDEVLNKQIESYRATFGSYNSDAEEVTDEKDMIKAKVTELENGLPKEEGIVVEEAVLMPMYIKDEEAKAAFIGAKKDSVLTFNPQKAYKGVEMEIATFLQKDKAEVAGITSDFSLEITEIAHYEEAALDQALYDKICGEGTVTDEESFRGKVRESIGEQYFPQSDYKFLTDIRPFLLDKAGRIDFADDILKRWILLTHDDYKTMEQVEEKYPKISEDLKFHLIKESIVKKNNIEIEDKDVEAIAQKIVRARLVQYGMLSVTDEQVSTYAKNMLQDKNALRNIADRAIEDKLVNWLKKTVTLDIKEVSIKEFGDLFQIEEQEQPV